MKIKINALNELKFIATIEKFNKKLARIKSSPIQSDVIGLTQEGQMDYIIYDVTIPEIKKSEYDYQGSICFKGDVRTIFSPNDVPLTHVKEPKCDHCNHKRKRNKVHVFRNGDKEIVIGSTCTDAYVGFAIERALRLLQEFSESTKEYGEPTGVKFVAMDETIQAAYSVYNSYSTYIKHYSPEATARRIVHNRVHGIKIDDAALNTTKELLITSFKDMDTSENFEANIHAALFHGDNIRKNIPMKSIGIVSYAVHMVRKAVDKIKAEEEAKRVAEEAAKNAPEPAPVAKAVPNTFIGAVGKELTLKGKVKLVKTCNNFYGESKLVVVDTEKGQVKTFSSGAFGKQVKVGETISFKGIVKKHDTFKRTNSTLLTRVKTR